MTGIGEAVDAMRNGKRVSRKGWNGKNMHLALKKPSDLSDMDQPYVYIKTVQGDKIPWLCSQADLLAEDWYIIEE